ncbi:hypothetical protein C7B61_00290 [filamentous cyanobacterium CCP1]|nr:hypothetical protein C7B76_16770 [filamentous cyanobacterium CCP2]PSB68537.1 hypothetical protein C7B61_00290 [filamentous cyanobacterium CCP1]
MIYGNFSQVSTTAYQTISRLSEAQFNHADRVVRQMMSEHPNFDYQTAWDRYIEIRNQGKVPAIDWSKVA